MSCFEPEGIRPNGPLICTGFDGSELVQQHARAMAELDWSDQREAFIEAFPDASLCRIFLAAGCWGIPEMGGTVQSEFHTGGCSILQVVRALS